MPNPNEARAVVTVTQEDREAAAALMLQFNLYAERLGIPTTDELLDTGPLVQAFARHRPAQADAQARVEVLEEVSLAECPPGLFWAGNTLGMKSEYGDNSGRIDAFIVESGEFFWGPPPQTIARQRAMLVRPIGYEAAQYRLAAPSQAEARVGALKKALYLAGNRLDWHAANSIANSEPRSLEYGEWADAARAALHTDGAGS